MGYKQLQVDSNFEKKFNKIKIDNWGYIDRINGWFLTVLRNICSLVCWS